MDLQERIKNAIRVVDGFPKEGISFKDITTLFLDPNLNSEIINYLYDKYKDHKLTAIVGLESRGFMFGFALAERLGVKFVPIRKAGKLPAETYQKKYELEYGSAKIEIHKDALVKGDRVLIHDDLLATGGTAAAAFELVKQTGAEVVVFDFLLELSFLKGKILLNRLANVENNSLILYTE